MRAQESLCCSSPSRAPADLPREFLVLRGAERGCSRSLYRNTRCLAGYCRHARHPHGRAPRTALGVRRKRQRGHLYCGERRGAPFHPRCNGYTPRRRSCTPQPKRFAALGVRNEALRRCPRTPDRASRAGKSITSGMRLQASRRHGRRSAGVSSCGGAS